MKIKSLLLLALWLALFTKIMAQEAVIRPVTPEAREEAAALLEYIYSISGKQTLSGQHCAPLVGSTRLSVVHRRTGHYPALFGQDFGFSYPGYWDGINYRQRIVDEAIRRKADLIISHHPLFFHTPRTITTNDQTDRKYL